MSNALPTQGVVLKRGDGGSPEVFTTVGEIRSFDGPGGSGNEIDVTHLSSTGKEVLIGLMDEGEISFEANLVPSDAAQTGLRADRTAGTRRNFKLYLTDSPQTILSFTALVKEFRISGGVDDAIRLTITLRITGAVTWA